MNEKELKNGNSLLFALEQLDKAQPITIDFEPDSTASPRFPLPPSEWKTKKVVIIPLSPPEKYDGCTLELSFPDRGMILRNVKKEGG